MVPFWVPIVVAIIAAYPVWLGIRQEKTATASQRENRETELALSGLAALVGELQEERKECHAEIRQLRAELNACSQRLREVEWEMRE